VTVIGGRAAPVRSNLTNSPVEHRMVVLLKGRTQPGGKGPARAGGRIERRWQARRHTPSDERRLDVQRSRHGALSHIAISTNEIEDLVWNYLFRDLAGSQFGS
jgi:hypothetical protein